MSELAAYKPGELAESCTDGFLPGTMARVCTLEISLPTITDGRPTPVVLVTATRCVGQSPHIEVEEVTYATAEGARTLAAALARAADWLEEEELQHG